MVKIDKDYVFEGPDGQLRLLDLFDGRRQLIVYHFMFDPSWDEGCPIVLVPGRQHRPPRPICTRATPRWLLVSRAPFAKIAAV